MTLCDTVTITGPMLRAGLTAGVGISSVQAAILGIDWPLRKGWRSRLHATRVSRHAYLDFLARKGEAKPKATRPVFVPPWVMET